MRVDGALTSTLLFDQSSRRCWFQAHSNGLCKTFCFGGSHRLETSSLPKLKIASAALTALRWMCVYRGIDASELLLTERKLDASSICCKVSYTLGNKETYLVEHGGKCVHCVRDRLAYKPYRVHWNAAVSLSPGPSIELVWKLAHPQRQPRNVFTQSLFVIGKKINVQRP